MSRKLPPIRGAVPADDENGGGDNEIDAAPRRRPRRRKPALSDEGAVDQQDNVAAGSTDQILPKKKVVKKKKKPATEAAGDAGDDEPETTTRPRPRRPRSARTGEDEVDAPEDAVGEDGEPKKRRKKKKKVQKAEDEEGGDGAAEDQEPDPNMDTDLLAELAGLQDEVVVAKDEQTLEKTRPVAVVSGTMLKSQPSSRLYIEHKSGFRNLARVKAEQQRAEQARQQQQKDEAPEVPRGSSLTFALGLHAVFKAIALVLQGLLAGVSLMHIIFTFVSAANKSDQEFLKDYQPYAAGFQAMMLFLMTLSLVSAFSRYDVARPTKRMLRRAVTFQSGAICIVLYFLAMTASLSAAALDDKISLYVDTNQTLWQDETETSSTLSQWRVMNGVRCGAAILAFIVICVRPEYDRFKVELKQAEKEVGTGAELELDPLTSA